MEQNEIMQLVVIGLYSLINMCCVIILLRRKPHEVVVTRDVIKHMPDKSVGKGIMTPNGLFTEVEKKRKTIVNTDESEYNKEMGY